MRKSGQVLSAIRHGGHVLEHREHRTLQALELVETQAAFSVAPRGVTLETPFGYLFPLLTGDVDAHLLSNDPATVVTNLKRLGDAMIEATAPADGKLQADGNSTIPPLHSYWLKSRTRSAFLSVALLGTLALTTFAHASFAADDATTIRIDARPRPAKPPKPPQTPDFALERRTAEAIQRALGVTGVEVQVFIDKDGQKTAVLSGNLGKGSEDKSALVAKRAARLVPGVVSSVVSLLLPQPRPKKLTTEETLAEAETKLAEEPVTGIWTRTFTSASVHSTQPGAEAPAASKSEERAEAIAKALNKMHGGTEKEPLIEAQGPSAFYLSGPRAKIVDIKRDLLRIDAVWPQVQLDFWTVQISGSPQSIAKDSAWIRDRFNRAGQGMRMVKGLLAEVAQDPRYLNTSSDLLRNDDTGLLKQIGFSPDCVRPLSLNESLIFLGLQSGQMDEAENVTQVPYQRGQRLAEVNGIDLLRKRIAALLNPDKSDEAKKLLKELPDRYKTNGLADAKKLLPHLHATYNTDAAPTRAGEASAASTSASAAGGVAALGELLAHPQLLFLGAALAPPQTEITKVSPGLTINVRPTVLPDGGSARLQLDFNFGVKTEVINKITDGDGRLQSLPSDGIESNHMATDITVSAFDLFNVSSFAIESSVPRWRYLPIIGSVPVLGELIKKPRKNKVTRHESIVLVNTTILPRILDLAHFYGE